MPQFSAIHIIYNPNSTGSSEQLAKAFRTKLKRAGVSVPVKLVQTTHAGHAKELAYELSKASKYPLILSASGDGGYHEVVNGLLRAQAEGAKPVAGLLPAGNANDHYNFIHQNDVIRRIIAGKTRTIDVLRFSGWHDHKRFTRYAHSYIGFGLTPDIGARLNKTDLTWLKEKWLVMKGLFAFRPISIVRNGKKRTYDSIIASNIGQMSKVLTLDETASVTDGKFELTMIRRHTRTHLLRKLLRASLASFDSSKRYTHYAFSSTRKVKAQLDGELYTFDANATISITCESKKLRCVV